MKPSRAIELSSLAQWVPNSEMRWRGEHWLGTHFLPFWDCEAAAAADSIHADDVASACRGRLSGLWASAAMLLLLCGPMWIAQMQFAYLQANRVPAALYVTDVEYQSGSTPAESLKYLLIPMRFYDDADCKQYQHQQDECDRG